MTDRAFIPVEEIDRAISSLEDVVRTCSDESARSLALTALAGLRVKLGLWNQEAPPWVESRIRFSRPSLPLFDSGRPELADEISEEFGSRREDGELDD